MKHSLLLAAAIACLPAVGHAVGDDTDEPPEPTETTTECSDGQIFDESTQECVDAAGENAFNDDQRYDAIRELAYAGAYDRALMIVATVDRPGDARFLNYQGFIHRKQGKLGVAKAFYAAALKVDPDYHLARSYLGQGLVAEGDLTRAKRQLAEIEARGGAGSWAHKALIAAVNGREDSDY